MSTSVNASLATVALCVLCRWRTTLRDPFLAEEDSAGTESRIRAILASHTHRPAPLPHAVSTSTTTSTRATSTPHRHWYRRWHRPRTAIATAKENR